MNLHCNLDLEFNHLIFTQNTPTYDDVPTNSIWLQKINGSAGMEETVIFDQMSPHCGPELEDRKPIFLHDILAHNVAPPYQVWLQKVQQLWRYRPDEHSLECRTFYVTLTWTTTQQSNLFTRQSIHLMMMCHQTKFSCKQTSGLDDTREIVIF